MFRIISYVAFYVFLCALGFTAEIIPNVNLSSVGAFLGALILSPAAGSLIGLIAMLLIGAWQGFPLAIAGHWVVAIAVATAAYYFGLAYDKFAGSWKKYVFSFVLGYLCYIGMGLLLLWILIGEQVLILLLPWSISAILCMLIAYAIDYGWPKEMRHYIGGPLPKRVSTGRNRARKRRRELYKKNHPEEMEEDEDEYEE